MRIAFLGLGVMGRPMAANLVASEHEVVVWNRTREKAEGLGAAVADSPAAAAEGADLVVTMLADDEAVESVRLGDDGFMDTLAEDAVHACMSTISVGLSRRLTADHTRRGQRYVAAPVFGRPDMAASGELRVVVGGAPETIEVCRPAFEVLGAAVIEAGAEPHQANAMKLAGNFMLTSAIEAMAEAYALVRAHDVDVNLFHRTMAEGLFASPVYQGYGGMIAAHNYEPPGFELGHGLKDVRYVVRAADEARVPMPAASTVFDRLLSAVARGWSGLDVAGLGRLAAHDAGQEA